VLSWWDQQGKDDEQDDEEDEEYDDEDASMRPNRPGFGNIRSRTAPNTISSWTLASPSSSAYHGRSSRKHHPLDHRKLRLRLSRELAHPLQSHQLPPKK